MFSARAVGVVSLLALASCYSWIGRYENVGSERTTGQKPFVDWGVQHWYVDIPARNVLRRETYAEDLFKCPPATPVVALRTDVQARDRPGQPRLVKVADASDGELLFRAGFISDVHIRQPEVKLFNDDVSRKLDTIVDSFERNGYQEAFQNAVYAATISAFNQLPTRDVKPRLVINTGDATDAGTIEEAYDFAALSYYLRYPMLYAIGNHDDAIFGNYKHGIGYTKDAGPTFYPVGQKERFLMFFNRFGRKIAGFSDKLVPLPVNPTGPEFNHRWGALDIPRENQDGVETSTPPNTCAPGSGACKQPSYCYGIDLYGPKRGNEQPCESYPGYYAVIIPGDSGAQVQLIGLNTSREQEWGQYAAFDTKQRDWLATELQRPATVTIVFMHHRPQESALGELMVMLRNAAAQRPFVVLTAHDHSYTTEWQEGFWELNTGSLEEFPQWARLLEIRRGANGQTYLNTRIVRPQLPLLATPPALTHLGVPAGLSPDYWDELPMEVRRRVERWIEDRFADCDEIAQRPSKSCGEAPKNLLLESAQCGYLGALHDHAFRHLQHRPTGPKIHSWIGKPQSGAAAFAEANVVLDISAPAPRKTP